MKDIQKKLFNSAISRQKESPIVRNNIKIVSLFFIGIFVLKSYGEWSEPLVVFAYIMSKWDLETVLWLLSLVVLPSGIVLFYIKKPLGWFLLALYATHAAVLNIGTFIHFIITSVSMLFKNGPATLVMIAYVLLSLFFLTIIVMLCNKNMRAVYGINNRTMIWILIITTLLTCLELSQHEFFLTL